MLGFSLVTLIHLLIALPLCGHVLLRKEQEPVAVGWIAVILLSPFVGSALYLLFGINRIERKARKLRGLGRTARRAALTAAASSAVQADGRILRISASVNDLPFLAGNSVAPLVNGDAAYPAMLAAIEAAEKSVALSTYIFDNDAAGQKFVAALSAAVRRGVTVRVLVDDIGRRYSRRAIDRDLKAGGVTTVRFIPQTLKFVRFFNLRNHRKLLVIDGQTGFIGGMNIRHGNELAAQPRHPIQDIHFEVRGPVLDQISALFEEDWQFATNIDIALPRWTGSGQPVGPVNARLVPDGPDHRSDTLQWLILGALAVSRNKVRIMTPYFIPNGALVSALCVAAMRGVDVEIVVPERSNIPLIDWAMAASFETLLTHNVKIFLGAPPFDHSKAMIVDGHWSLVGSTNWDQRSLRLNFEANLECLCPLLGAELERYIEGKKAKSKAVSLAKVRAAPPVVRLRNNFVRLFGPYL